MATRGLIGYYKNKVTKATYNHYDSYPSYMGEIIKEHILTHPVERMITDFNRTTLINEDDEPTPELVTQIKNFWYGVVDQEQGLIGWEDMYSLLHDHQGHLDAYAHSGVMIDNKSFFKESLSCEWAYIINLDTNTLEIYRGFQTHPCKNRYALTKPEIAEIKTENNCKGYFTQTRNPKTGKIKRVFHKSSAYYNCALIAVIPFVDLEEFDMDTFKIRVYAHETQARSDTTIVQKHELVPGSARKDAILDVLLITGYIRDNIYNQEKADNWKTKDEALERFADYMRITEEQQLKNQDSYHTSYNMIYVQKTVVFPDLFPDVSGLPVLV